MSEQFFCMPEVDFGELSAFLDPRGFADLPVVEMPSPPSSEDDGKMAVCSAQSYAALNSEQMHQLVYNLSTRLYAVEQVLAGYMQASYMVPPPFHPEMPSSSPSASTSSPSPTRSRSYDASLPSMSEMEAMCSPLFARDPHPGNQELRQLAEDIIRHCGAGDRRSMVSHIRKWFRKHRDENGQKVFHACIELIQPLIDGGADVEYIRFLLQQGPFREQMLAASRLDISDGTNAFLFMESKIEAYFTRRVLPSR